MNSAPTPPPSNLLEPEKRQVVASGEVGESSGPATGRGSGPTRPCARRPVSVGELLPARPWGWRSSYWEGCGGTGHINPSVREHWAAVARGRDALRRGRPDLALQAVNTVRDEAPGSGEAMTVAGLALLRLGEYRGARLALERALKLQPNQFDAAITLAELNFGLGNGPPWNRSPPDGRSAPTARVPSLAHHGQGSPRPRRLSQGNPSL